ncbi:Uncharacterised protein [Mycoplasmopsis edwardii]|uniref:Uncharacterized protein n=1 Tax=Mycoplasmopsis edwardii TaxID=53558 RepID=A0A3B0QA25_9BACT|nr:Uncharacterised protein [Mycoplasmopsis edwardii]
MYVFSSMIDFLNHNFRLPLILINNFGANKILIDANIKIIINKIGEMNDIER